jgi:hypothetical protein
VELPEKLKAPEIRQLTLAEQQRLRALGETMAEQALGPEWKKPVVKRKAGYALLQAVANASVIRGNISPATTCGIQWESSSQNWLLEWCR